MKNQSDRIEQAFRLGYPIDDAVNRAVQLAKENRLPADVKSKRTAKPLAPQKPK